MKSKIQNVIIFLIFIMVPGCLTFSGPTGQGILITNQESPLLVADSNVPSKDTLKIGKAECANVLGLFSFGDCSINTAIENGGISKIHYIDKELGSFLFIFSNQTTVIYGE